MLKANISDSPNLRQKAEEILNKKSSKSVLPLSEVENLKLIHELEVHQIELEMQQEETALAREKAELAQHKYTRLYDFAPSGYLTLSKQGVIEELNHSAAQMLGKERSRLVKSSFGFFVSENTRPVFNHFLEKVFTSKDKETCELILTREDNTSINLQMEGVFSDNNDQCLISVVDISRHTQAEQELKESETKFKEIINQINDAIVVFDQQGKIIVWNRGAEQISNLKAHDALNSNIIDIQYQFAPKGLKDKTQIENSLNGILTLKTPEVFNRIIDNDIITLNPEKLKNIQYNIFPIQLNGYNLFCSVIRDTTKIKQYEKQLQQLNLDKDRFISILAHDLKSPFCSILGYLEMLIENIRDYDIDQIESGISIVNNSAQGVYNLLEDLLAWALSQAGKLPYEPQKLSLATVFRNILADMKPIADKKNITINHLFNEETTVFADNNMLKTILRNLATNAIKFTMPDGQIDIGSAQNHTNITITVSDNGIGIEPEILARLFDISNAHTTYGTAKESGTGLGLLLCKEFVEKHNGKIWIESELEKGTVVKFTLPNG